MSTALAPVRLSPPRAPSAPPVPPPDAGAALALYACVLGARTPAAAHALVGALAADFRLARATIAFHDGGRTVLLASSSVDVAQAPPALAAAWLGALDEAIEQGRSLAWPAADGDIDDDPIRIELQALQRATGNAVAALPLGGDGVAHAALCLEREAPFDAAALARFESLLALAAPALRWMQTAALPWRQRLRRDLADAWDALRRPQRRATRRALGAGAVALAFAAAAPLEHDVGGRARVEGAEQRVLVAPADGFVKTAHVRPGDRVAAGAPLVDLVDGDLRLERERWSSQLAQHENAYAAAMAKADRAAASTALARISEAQAQLALVDEQLVRGRVVAPFDGLVIQGDLGQSIGALVRQGDTLLTLATTGRQRVVVDVDEVDIAAVRPGQRGSLALSSLPWRRTDIVVERIVPLAKAVDGRNVFEVEARLVVADGALRPGLIGRAEIGVGRLPPLWAWLGHAADRVRVAWWAWLG